MTRRGGLARSVLASAATVLAATCLLVADSGSSAASWSASSDRGQIAPLVPVPRHNVALSPAAHEVMADLERALPPTTYGGVGLLARDSLVVLETASTDRGKVLEISRSARLAGVRVTERRASHSLAELNRLVDRVFTAVPAKVGRHLTGATVDRLANRVQVFLDRVSMNDRRLLGTRFPGLVELSLMSFRLNFSGTSRSG